MKSKKLTMLAMSTALSILLMYLSSVLPTGQLGFIAAASLLGFFAVIETRVSGALMLYAASSILALLLVPRRTPVFLYIIFFGYYPIIKFFAERIRTRILSWCVKLFVFNAAFTVVFLLFKEVIFDISMLQNSTVIAFAAGNIVFVLFDIGVSKLIWLYKTRLNRYFRHK
ncbi:MAG: hypothetical protein AB7C97_08130 [Oscillospiraceae bacterium]